MGDQRDIYIIKVNNRNTDKCAICNQKLGKDTR